MRADWIRENRALFLLALLPWPAAAASLVTGVDFKNVGSNSEITVTADGPITFEKKENSGDSQIVLEIKGATLAKSVSRKLDTSSFESKVTLISPYQADDSPDTVRVVVQLKEFVQAEASQDGNSVKLVLPGAGGDAVASAPPAEALAEPPPSDTPPVVAEATGDPASLDKFMENRERKVFTGKPITMNVRDASVVEVFRLISEASGFNIVVSEDVQGTITLSLADVPWDQVLDLVLQTKSLAAERNYNVLRIVTVDGYRREKINELSAKAAAEASAPRITRVFPISYAQLGSMVTILTTFGTQPAAALAGGGAEGARTATTQIMQDQRTNSIIVRDLAENIDRMKKLIEILDTETPQVLIESKIIEARESFTRAIAGNIGFGNAGNNTQFFASFNSGNPLDQLLTNGNGAGIFDTGEDISATSAGGANFGISPTLTFLPGIQRLNAVLNIAESDDLVKVVASPRTVVLNGQNATITQGLPFQQLQPVAGTLGGGSAPVTAQANLTLGVTPIVTNDGGVQLTLNIQNDTPAAGAAAGSITRNLSTQVLVPSGQTLVLGGIYRMESTMNSSGIPLLRKIPIIGVFFGSEAEAVARTELFIFVTPRILNKKEAGISG